MTNINPETGTRYTVFSLNNSIDPDVAHDLWYGPQARDLSYAAALEELRSELDTEANAIEAEVRDNLADANHDATPEYIDFCIEAAYLRLGYSDREDYIETLLESRAEGIEIDEPEIEGTLDGVSYRIGWLGGAPLLWVLESPYTATFRLCSPCVPNACNADSPDPDGYEGYTVPEDWLATNKE